MHKAEIELLRHAIEQMKLSIRTLEGYIMRVKDDEQISAIPVEHDDEDEALGNLEATLFEEYEKGLRDEP